MPDAPLFLVDGSSYVYRAYFALPPLTSPSGQPTNAAYGFSSMLLKLLKDATPALLALVFDAPGETFRDTMYAEYKSNRPETPPDLSAQWPLVLQVAEALKVTTLRIPGVEADDVIATLAHRAEGGGIDCVIVTSDKDLLQLVGPHTRIWDTMHDKWTDAAAVRERFGVSPGQLADIMGLVGDPIDNIPGVRGIGAKTASALIRHFGSLDGVLQHLDEVPTLEIRGAKKVAQLLREQAEQARLSRDLALLRRDVPLDVTLADLAYSGPDPAATRRLFTDLGFQSLLRELPPPEPSRSPEPVAVQSPTAVQSLIDALASAPAVSLACVASGHPMTTDCLGVVLAAPGGAPHFVPAGEGMLAGVATLAGNPAVMKVGHDLKSDIIWLARLGVPLAGPQFDTMVASYLLGATATHRLDHLSRELLGDEIEPFRDGASDPARVAAGVQRMAPLHRLLSDRLEASGMARLFAEVEMPLVGVLARMEQRGVRLNTQALEDMGAQWRHRLASLTEEIHALAGGAFNIGSPQQLRTVLFDLLGLSQKGVRRGKTGLSTDVDVLTRLAADHPLPAKILEYRGLAKLLSTYVDALLAAVHPVTGRLHSVFNQAVAATGRLSSSDPNLQNIPIRGEEGRRIRAAFIPAEGAVFVAADYSQIELRVMAHLSQDPVLLAAFAAGEDIHARTAADLFQVLPGTVTTDMRRVAKVINFGIMYGMGPQRLAGELGIPHAAAQRYIEQYFARYQGVRNFIEHTIAAGRETGYVATLFGRRRAMPELNSRNRATAQAAERAAINMPIQGTAADLIKIAMVRIDRRISHEGLSAQMILQVHDELVLEVEAVDLERTAALVREEMEGAAALSVPLSVDVGRGANWAEAH